MMKKLIISDLDGTIIKHDENDELIIVDELVKTINSLDENIYFNIATGRHYADVLKILEKYNIKTRKNMFIIGANGAHVYDSDKEKIIYERFINDKESISTNNVVEFFDKSFNGEILIFGYSSDFGRFFINNGKKNFETLKNEIEKFEDNDNVFKTKILNEIDYKTGVYKVLIYFPKDIKQDIILKHINAIYEQYNDINIFMSNSRAIEIVPRDVDKQYAIEYVYENFFKDISKENIYVFGDEGNDIKMLSSNKNSFTRHTAHANVRSIVKHVINKDASDFVNYGIHEFVLKK